MVLVKANVRGSYRAGGGYSNVKRHAPVSNVDASYLSSINSWANLNINQWFMSYQTSKDLVKGRPPISKNSNVGYSSFSSIPPTQIADTPQHQFSTFFAGAEPTEFADTPQFQYSTVFAGADPLPPDSSAISIYSNPSSVATVYSVASSRTASTDYGLYYTRHALSIESLQTSPSIDEIPSPDFLDLDSRPSSPGSIYSVASSRTNSTDYGTFYTRHALSMESLPWEGDD